jgi:hypothetical protein
MVIHFPIIFKGTNWPFSHVLLNLGGGGGCSRIVFCKIPSFHGGVCSVLEAV